MGIISNYNWLKEINNMDLPSPDDAKLIATQVELNLAKRLKKIRGVIEVFHSKRFTKINGGRSRREVDLIVVTKWRISLIEIKNYRGQISMDEEGVLFQNKERRNWSFEKLDDAKKRINDNLRESGINLGDTEVQSILHFNGRADLDKSVNVGKMLRNSSITNDFKDLEQIISQDSSSKNSSHTEHIEQVIQFFNSTGTWDQIELINGAILDGDFSDFIELISHRKLYQRTEFKNSRSWLATLFFGPKMVATLHDWEGNSIEQEIDPEFLIQINLASTKKSVFDIRHVKSIRFGYPYLVDWSKNRLVVTPKSQKSEKKNESSEQPYSKGEIVHDATVSDNHPEYGVFFTLDSKNSGLYKRTKMSPQELALSSSLYQKGKRLDVEIKQIKKHKKKPGWHIEVAPNDD